MDLLNLTAEDIYYLKALIKKKCSGAEVQFFLSAESNHWIYILPYQAPSPEPVAESSDPGVASKLLSAAGTFFASMLPAKPVEPQRPENFSIRLSHHLLIERKGTEINCFACELLAFDKGAFGSVFLSPLAIKITENNEIQFTTIPMVIKLQIYFRGAKACGIYSREPSVRNEFTHLKQIYPETRMLNTADGPRLPSMRLGPEAYDFFWIIMPKIEGVALHKLPMQDITLAQKFKIALSLIRNLKNLHDPGELGGEHIHNDIKPENIIISANHTGAFCDWGGATKSHEPMNMFSIHFTRYKKLGQPSTPAYDIHSLGIILFQLFIDSSQIPQGRDRWKILPKGQAEKVVKYWTHGKEMAPGFKPTKLFKPGPVKSIYEFTHPSVFIADNHIAGLSTSQSERVFETFKEMRSKESISLADAFMRLFDMACQLPDFDRDYFIKDDQTQDAAPAAAGCSYK